jgi:hypothetical protein
MFNSDPPIDRDKGLGHKLMLYFRHTPLACSSVISPGTYYPTAQPNYGMKILLITVYGTYVIAT